MYKFEKFLIKQEEKNILKQYRDYKMLILY